MEDEIKNVLKNLFYTITRTEVEIEEQRQILAAMEDFEPSSTFSLIDSKCKGYVTPQELLSFMKNNGGTSATENDLYLLVKYFDSMQSDRLILDDYIQVLLPCSNDYLRSAASSRKTSSNSASEKVSKQL